VKARIMYLATMTALLAGSLFGACGMSDGGI
jgi:hypothetical protein